MTLYHYLMFPLMNFSCLRLIWKKHQKTTVGKRLDNLSDKDLVIMESVADGIIKSKEVEDK